MKKRVLSMFIAVIMVLSLTGISAMAEVGDVAKIGDTEYTTLAAAISAVTDSTLTTITLLDDVTENVTIPADRVITLDLNGYTLSNVTGDTITNNGALTITDTASGGAVFCQTAGKSSLLNNVDAVAVISGGTLYKTLNTSSSDYYVVNNRGTLTMNGGTVHSSSTYSSAIENGWYTPSQNTTAQYATMTINGGTVAGGGLYTVKNDDYGIMTINGGTFTNNVANTGTVLNWNDLTITGGTFNAANCAVVTATEPISSGSATHKYPYEIGKTIISGGYFKGNLGVVSGYSTAIKVEVSGGYFTADPSAYVADGKIAVASNTTGYNFMVAVKSVTAAEVVEGVSTAEPATGLTGEEATNAAAVATAITTSGLTTSGLTTAANNIAQNNNVTADDADVVAALADANITVDSGDTVTIVIEPYLEITINGYTEDENGIKVTLDISAFYDVIATTATSPNEMTDENSASVTTGLPMTVITPVTVTIPLSEDLYTALNAADSLIYIQHTASDGNTYYYDGTLSAGDGYYLTFTTTHGFSPFVILTDSRTADVTFCDEGRAIDTTIGANGVITYTAADVGSSLPGLSKAGYIFSGWKFYSDTDFTTEVASLSSPYLTLTDALLTALYDSTVVEEGEGSTPPPVVIKALPVFTPIPTGGGTATYTITATAGADGTVSPASANVTKGASHTVTITPKTGYAVADVKVDGVSVGAVGSYIFENVQANHTVAATFKLAFTDVNLDDWFYGEVKYVFDKGIMNGISSTLFDPNGNATRGMLVTILWRLEGEPAPQGENPFTDLTQDWYKNAVIWASEHEIVKGYGDGTFGPENNVTREQMVAILCRYADYKGIDVSAAADLTAFTDAKDVSDYALPAMQWAVAKGLINGRTTTTLVPAGLSTRAELATVIMRYIESIA